MISYFKGYYLREDAWLDNNMANERIMTIIDNEILIFDREINQ